MIENFDLNLSEINTISIAIRLILSVFIGGVIGLEREIDHKVAGLRTHMLVSLGAAIVMITNQYIYESFPNADVDITRLGAQVISGIGFLGAGTILVISNHKISGLTTAAGLWTTAILSLSVGIGFYKLAIMGTSAVLFVTIFLKPFKRKIVTLTEESKFSISVYSVEGVRGFIKYSNEMNAHLSNFIIDEESIYSGESIGTSFHVTIDLDDDISQKEFVEGLREVKGIKFIEMI